MNAGASIDRIPENVSVIVRPMVTAGLANPVGVNQNVAPTYAATLPASTGLTWAFSEWRGRI
jgi:CTP:molybdopterin cytidylyltransferase MocA